MTYNKLNYIQGDKLMSKQVKVKKPFYKKWWVWLLAIIVVASVGGAGEEEQVTEADVQQSIEEGEQAREELAKANEIGEEVDKLNEEVEKQVGEDTNGDGEVAKNDEGISKEEFDQIKNGMTYEEVTSIIGGEGEVMSEVGEAGTQFYTIMYMYDGESGLGSNANFTYQDNKLQSKAQFGLE